MEDTRFEGLSKLAAELIDRVDSLEAERAGLMDRVIALEAERAEMDKRASEAKPAVGEAAVDTAVACLVKAGALEPGEAPKARAAMLADPESLYRVLPEIVDAQALAKTASPADALRLRGGEVASGQPARAASSVDESLDRALRMLRLD